MSDQVNEGPNSSIQAVSDQASGVIEASCLLQASAPRLFEALASDEICRWWVRPGVFDTRAWAGEVRQGGRWTASGIGGGQPYALEGEFLLVDRPTRLVHTWKPTGALMSPARVSYDLVPIGRAVRLVLRHEGLPNPDVLERTRLGWVTSFERLREILAEEARVGAGS
jgi:uncharacterized protein YndB with AHSA1/START domain